MNKWIRWSLIFGVIFCLSGIGMMTAGAVMGGVGDVGYQLHKTLGKDPFPGKVHYDVEVEHHAEYTKPDAATGATEQSGGQNAAERKETKAASASGDGAYRNVASLEIETSGGTVTVKQEKREDPQDTAIYVERSSSGRANERTYEIRTERDTLKIEAPKGAVMENLAIRVPEGYTFREVDVEAWQSNVSIDALRANKLSLELNGGAINAAHVSAGELDVECDAGAVTLNIEGDRNQYNYELSNRYGVINLGDRQAAVYKDYMDERYLNNGAGKKADLSCESGTITLKFLNEV